MYGKQVGNAFEREFAKLLSKWLSGSDQELVVWRNQSSGSVGTKRMNKGLSGNNIDGDIQCLDLKYKSFFDVFYLDTKTFQDGNLLFINSSNQKSNKILNEWLTVEEAAKKQNKIPLMPLFIRDGKTPKLLFLGNDVVFCGSFMRVNIKEEIKFQYVVLNDFFKENEWESFIKLQQI